MSILLKNARILKMTAEPIFEGEIVVTGNKIEYVGPKRKHTEKFEQEIDCEGNLVMPGFKNAHAHSGMSFLRSRADDMALAEWLSEQVFPYEAFLTEEDIYWLSQLSFLEYLTSGITAAFDQYYFPQATAKAAEDFGMRELILITSSQQSRIGYDEMLQKIGENDRGALVNYCLGFHAEYTVEPEEIEIIKAVSKKLKTPFFTHLAETRKEVSECKERRDGMTPAEFVDSLGLWDYGGGAYHCCYMTANDLKIFKEKDLSVVSCPASNAKLASGIAEIETMRRESIEIALGTDGPASNNALDMFREMFLVAGLQKILCKDPVATPAWEVLKMATLGSAHAMNLEDANILEAGKFADLIMVDLKRPNMQPLHHITNNLVFSGSKENIKMTMINGKILYKDGEFQTKISADKVYNKVQEISDRIFGKVVR